MGRKSQQLGSCGRSYSTKDSYLCQNSSLRCLHLTILWSDSLVRRHSHWNLDQSVSIWSDHHPCRRSSSSFHRSSTQCLSFWYTGLCSAPQNSLGYCVLGRIISHSNACHGLWCKLRPLSYHMILSHLQYHTESSQERSSSNYWISRHNYRNLDCRLASWRHIQEAQHLAFITLRARLSGFCWWQSFFVLTSPRHAWTHQTDFYRISRRGHRRHLLRPR